MVNIEEIENKFNIRIKLNHKNDAITSINFNIKPDDYINICDSDGELLPTCCSEISSIRDSFIDSLRDGCFIDIKNIHNIYLNALNHNFDQNHPISNVCRIYKELENLCNLKNIYINTIDVCDINDITFDLAINHVLEFLQDYLNYDSYSDEKPKRVCANFNLSLKRSLPYIKILYEKIRELNSGSVECYALVDSSNNEFYKTYHCNLLLNDTFEQAQATQKHLMDISKEEKKIKIQKIRISFEKGIEFLN